MLPFSDLDPDCRKCRRTITDRKYHQWTNRDGPAPRKVEALQLTCSCGAATWMECADAEIKQDVLRSVHTLVSANPPPSQSEKDYARAVHQQKETLQ